ncbi:MAG: Glu-tRNA(Gln) amidotransferase subunit GatD [Candidatus Bathyarchaeota archaeon]|nr:Glu-tRNA(Gln) amidotransferase subunit GatD [Candidatus Bathyarchaeota archaeon]
MSKEFSGYRGEVLEAIRKAEVEIGNLIQISRDGESYEGILIPRSEYGDQKHIVIKLKNGYNIGVRITKNTKIRKIGKGAKPAFAPPPRPKQRENLPKVTILSTGGTIASRVDYRTGGVRPALTASDLYSVVPELAEVAVIDAQILFSLFSENITPKHWAEVAKAVAEQISKGVEGVVIAHGTDTLGYTAAALSFALQNLPVPVILVGSQRSADRPSSDAATNLIGAVTAAAYAPFAEVAVAMHETPSDTAIAIHRGTKVRKCHTSRRDAFKSVNTTSIARVQDQKLIMLTDDYRKRNSASKLVLKPKFDEKVALIKFYPGIKPQLIDWYVEQGFKGLVIEGTGLGHVGRDCFEPIRKAVEHDVLVAVTSQCIWGRVNMNVYDSGRDLLNLGAIPLEDILPETALVKLMWVQGQTHNLEEAKRLLIANIAGEFSPRTLAEGTELI